MRILPEGGDEQAWHSGSQLWYPDSQSAGLIIRRCDSGWQQLAELVGCAGACTDERVRSWFGGRGPSRRRGRLLLLAQRTSEDLAGGIPGDGVGLDEFVEAGVGWGLAGGKRGTAEAARRSNRRGAT